MRSGIENISYYPMNEITGSVFRTKYPLHILQTSHALTLSKEANKFMNDKGISEDF